MSTEVETHESRIAALKARIETARAERDALRARDSAAKEAAQRQREADARARQEALSGQLRAVSDEFGEQSKVQDGIHAEMNKRAAEVSVERQSMASRFTELSSTLSALKQSMQEDRKLRQQSDEALRRNIQSVKREAISNAARQRDALASMRTELYDDLNRKHEEVRGMVGATASARESASFNDEGDEDDVIDT